MKTKNITAKEKLIKEIEEVEWQYNKLLSMQKNAIQVDEEAIDACGYLLVQKSDLLNKTKWE